ALALATQYLFLRSYRIWLRSRTQSYQFHALRDRLQLLAVERKIDQRSPAYNFLIYALNLSIRNAGKLKLRQVVALARCVDKRGARRREVLVKDIMQQDDEVKQIAAETFTAFGLMLVKNDSVLYVACLILKVLARVYTHPYPATFTNVAKR